MKINSLQTICFLLVIVALGSCSNSNMEERIATLEQKVAKLEGNPSATNQPVSVQNVNQAETASTSSGAVPAFEFKETDHDFGTITEGDVVEHIFSFTNTGEAPLVIQSASASCGCTVPQWPKEPVAVGGTGEIKVQFNSANKPGIQNKTVTIVANTSPSTTTLRIKSNVTAKGEETAGPVRK